MCEWVKRGQQRGAECIDACATPTHRHVDAPCTLTLTRSFTADLVRHLSPVPKSVQVDFIKAQSYGLGISSSGEVHIDEAFDLSVVKDKHVLVAE